MNDPLIIKMFSTKMLGWFVAVMKMEDGQLVLMPDRREKYVTEGTPRQYTFYVPQDVPGLAQLMGGRKSAGK